MRQKVAIDAKTLSDMVIEGLLEKKGVDILRIDLRDVQGAVSNYFVLATGTSDRHAQALADSVIDTVRQQAGEKPLSTEGMQAGEWVLLDYVDVVLHIFQQDKREFYNIEELWGDGEFETIES